MSKSIQEALHILIEAFEAVDIKPPIEMVLERDELSRLTAVMHDLNYWMHINWDGGGKSVELFGIKFHDRASQGESR